MRLLFTLFLIFIGLFKLFSQSTLNLTDCLEYAFEHNLEVIQYSNNINKANVRLAQTRLDLLPTINAEYNHYLSTGRTLNSEIFSWEDENIQQGNIAFVSDLVIFQGLYNIYNRKSAVLSEDLSSLKLERKKLLLGLEVVALFHKIALNKSSIRILELTNSNTQKEIAKLEEQITAGTMPRSNLYELLAQEKKEKVSILSLYNQQVKEHNNLSRLINWQEEINLELNSKIRLGLIDNEVLNNVLDSTDLMLLENSVLTSIATKDLEITSNSIALKRSFLYPTLSANATFSSSYLKDAVNPGSARENYDYSNQFDNNQHKPIALTVSIPIFNRNQKNTEIKLTRLDLANKELEYEKVKNQLSNELLNIQNDINSLSKKIIETNQMVEAFNKSYEVASEKFSSGLLDSYTLNLSKNNYTSSLLQLNKLKLELTMNIELLKLYRRFIVES